MREILPITKFLLDFFGIQYIITLQTCYKQGSLTLKTKTGLYSIPVSNVVMNQTGVDMCNLPEIDRYCSLVVCIDYFSKWSETKPL